MAGLDITGLLAAQKRTTQLIEARVLAAATKLTLDAHRNLVEASPVDTGAFRGAWTAVVPSKAFQDGLVENPTEYGPALVEGHSRQAPTGWLENAIKKTTL